MTTFVQAAPARFQLDRTRHAAPQVFEHLRDMIISLQLTPGTVLSRADLAERYNISQTPVRDALIRLSEEGLVDIFPQHATVVSAIDINLATQAHFLRRSVELEIVRTLAETAAPELVRQLRLIITRQSAMLDAGDFAEFRNADLAFHHHMYEAANVPDLWPIVRKQSGHLDRLRSLHLPVPGKAAGVVADHITIVDAIEKGNAAEAEIRLRKHLSGTLSNIDDLRARFSEFIKQ